ncbi:ankyrin repeat protein [Colletotrichum plurivorum]|uniref:Ankyrin repeat protein n=1 Tax=Colletotrichum plurivorum TaxID=2175906 RepID=A0A8H6JVF1_9PEZI|nr:ankyrin repeat protein [Colletotrichum plurivorum]
MPKSDTMPKRLAHGAYSVGWICPLEVEQIAAIKMLDETHESVPQSSTDHNVYKLGSINGYNIVIAGLHGPGNVAAATVVTQMRTTFPNLRYGLLVGIGGGVPVTTDHGIIRLGHIVVSKPTGIHSGTVKYDHGKAIDGVFERTGALAPPPALLLNAAQSLATHRTMADTDPLEEHIKRIDTSRKKLSHFQFPGVEKDHLYPLASANHDDGDSDIVIHRGTIASGGLVVKDASLRDGLARQHGILCFETEAAGVLEDFHCIVIRGIADYCDSRKNNDWHGYAAAVAAAYGRELFFHMPIDQQVEIIYFFFKDDSDDQRTSSRALRSLLYQILAECPHLFSDEVLESLDQLGEKQLNSFVSLWDIFIGIASHDQAGEVFCILDGLEECDNNEHDQIITTLCGFNEERGGVSRLKFLITSRPYDAITKAFQKSTCYLRIRGEEDAQVDKIAGEIETFTDSTVRALEKGQRFEAGEMKIIREKLTRIRHRTYLWVYLVCEMLQEMQDITKSSLEAFFDTLPETVENAYEKILPKEQKDREKAEIFLHIIVAAARPLSLEQMATAFATHKQIRGSSKYAEPERKDRFERTIRNICGLFVTIYHSKIYLIHQTAKEFLVRHQFERPSTATLSWESSLWSGDSNKILLKICVKYLLTTGDKHSITQDNIDDERSLEEFAAQNVLFDYSAKYWAEHVRNSPTTTGTPLQHDLLKICDVGWKGCLLWFHYHLMCATGRYFKAPRFTSLMIASYVGAGETARHLLQDWTPAHVNETDRSSNSALWYAASNGHTVVVDELLRTRDMMGLLRRNPMAFERAQVDQRGLREETPLLVAAKNGHEAVVRLLVEKGDATVDLPDNILRTPLSHAAENGHESIVKFLLSKKANPNLESKSGKTAYMYAKKRERRATYRWLDSFQEDWEWEKKRKQRKQAEMAAEASLSGPSHRDTLSALIPGRVLTPGTVVRYLGGK